MINLSEKLREIQENRTNQYRFYRVLTEQLFKSLEIFQQHAFCIPTTVEVLQEKINQHEEEVNELKLRESKACKEREGMKTIF